MPVVLENGTMNGVVFKDDCQIVRGFYAKVYGPAPQVVVTIRPLIETAILHDTPKRTRDAAE